MLEHRALHAHRGVPSQRRGDLLDRAGDWRPLGLAGQLPQPCEAVADLALVPADDAADHHREAEGWPSGLVSGVNDALPTLARLFDRRVDDVVLVRKAYG